MKQNVFTFTHPLRGKTDGGMLDFNDSIQHLASEGWIVKQVSTAAYTQSDNPYLALTVLAEKAE